MKTTEPIRMLARIAALIARGGGFDAVCESLPRQLNGLAPCDGLVLAFLHSDGGTLVIGPVHAKRKTQLASGQREPAADSGLLQDRAVHDLAVHARRFPQSRLLAALVNDGCKSCLAVPLVESSGRVAGLLLLSSLRRGAYAAAHLQLLQPVAAFLELLLERARLLGRLAAGKQSKSLLAGENLQLKEIIARAPALTELAGESPPWRKTLREIEWVSATDSTVLVRGETGTGKELIARAIHKLSARKDQPFVAVNCGALSRELIASELFGHERGAFTGALERRLGRLDLAQHGTLFLDEVAELPPELQVKLLRVLQEREYERVGGAETLKADVRIIAATNRDLEQERAAGRFREDLFFRLNVFPIFVPPLRERKEDIEPLLRAFLRRFAQKAKRTFTQIDEATIERCLRYHWPGNVRELENLVERGVILSRGEMFYMDPLLEAEMLPPAPHSALSLDEAIKAHLVAALKATGGKIYGRDGAAARLGLKPSTLQAKLKKYGLSRKLA